jgi:hypothetical protein
MGSATTDRNGCILAAHIDAKAAVDRDALVGQLAPDVRYWRRTRALCVVWPFGSSLAGIRSRTSSERCLRESMVMSVTGKSSI